MRRLADLAAPLAPTTDVVPWIPAGLVWTPRWVLLHLIEETARHAGHADIIRESIDGATCWTLMAAAEGWPRRTGRRGRRTYRHRKVGGACRSMYGPTTRAHGARSAWPGSSGALDDFEHGDEVTVVHRSFELNRRCAGTRRGHPGGAPRRRYGMSPEQVRAGHAHLTALGAEVGFTFDFEGVRSGSTFDAHRLTQAVRGTEHEDALVQGLFAAHFTDGRQLSDPDVLRAVAHAAGVPSGVTEIAVGGTAGSAEVRADEAAAEERDVTGVPYFLIDGAWPIPGAQDVETFGIVLRRAWSRLGQ